MKPIHFIFIASALLFFWLVVPTFKDKRNVQIQHQKEQIDSLNVLIYNLDNQIDELTKTYLITRAKMKILNEKMPTDTLFTDHDVLLFLLNKYERSNIQ